MNANKSKDIFNYCLDIIGLWVIWGDRGWSPVWLIRGGIVWKEAA
jgi:hypothetical protein